MKFFLFILLILFTFQSSYTQNRVDKNSIYSPNTLKQQREEFKKNLYENSIFKNISYPLNDENEDKWMGAFWGIKISLFHNDVVLERLRIAAADYVNRSEEFRRNLLEVIYTVYTLEFVQEVENFLKWENSPKNFAMCVNYLLQSKVSSLSNDELHKILFSRFQEVLSHPILFMLFHKLSGTYDESLGAIPSLRKLMTYDLIPGKTIIYSFQRKNRNYQGIAIIKKSDGTFLRTKNDSIFYVPQLARAISNLPGYLTNGNTPQGIFSIQGIDTSKNIFIGPSPNIQLVLPFEADLQTFFHNDKSGEWSIKEYQTLLPEEWHYYLPIYEAFYAGKAGRNEIIAHGTTVDPSFYNGKAYYPNTPTLGCLSAIEIWSDKTGNLTRSDQIELVNAFLSTGVNEGYLFVIELDDKRENISIDEIYDLILSSEKK